MSNKRISLEDRVPKLKEKRKRKAKKKLKRLLFTLFLLVLTVLYFDSPYSKVETVSISGTKYVTEEEIKQWCEVDDETIFLFTRNNKLESKLLEHPEIKSAKVGHVFPNELTITVEENEVIGYFAEGEKLYPILETGEVLKEKPITYSDQLPVFTNFKNDSTLTRTVEEMLQLPEEVLNDISEVCYAPSEEDAGLVYLYMNDGNMIKTSPNSLAENVSHYPSMVAQLGGKKGVIDMEVGYYFTSYEDIKKKAAQKAEEEAKKAEETAGEDAPPAEEKPAEEAPPA